MNDNELLELAAKAAGATYFSGGEDWDNPRDVSETEGYLLDGEFWTPLTDDGDALRLAVSLSMQVVLHHDWVEILVDGIQLSSVDGCYSADGCMLETTRRAIVRAAAEIGRSMP